MGTPSAIHASSLTKRYSDNAGIFDLDLDMAEGSIVGLIGPSGSGKTTTVRLMTGLLSPDSGDLAVLGQAPRNFDNDRRARIGYMPQDSILYPTLTLRQNIAFAGSLYGMRKGRKERIQSLLEFLELSDVADRLPTNASGGERRRAALAATFVHSPELIFLDEPTAGLDPVLRRKLWNRFEELSEAGRTLVVTTQYVGEAAYCDRVAVLASGRVLALDTPEGLRRLAYGGDLVDVSFPTRPAPSVVQYLDTLNTGSHSWIDDQTIRLVVDDGGVAVPEIVKWTTENQVELGKAEVHMAAFDDIFVELIEKLRPDENLETDQEEVSV
jgi:ABC-2 type transport system ATP-binding protein